MWWIPWVRYYHHGGSFRFGYVEAFTITGKKITYELFQKDNEVFSVVITGFPGVEYSILEPKKVSVEMDSLLKQQGIKARERFIKGMDI
jgi:hypothetical protein